MNCRSLASQLCRAVLGACVLTALCSFAPAASQSLAQTSSSVAGLLNDGLSPPPPATGTFAYHSFVPSLTIGASYTDPVFGTTVKRITTDGAFDNLYARNMWWNADETRYWHYGKVMNLVTNTVEYSGMPNGDTSNTGFDPVDPNVYYYFSGSSIHKVTLQGGGTFTDTVYFTAPGGATIKDLGGTLNWFDASGRYMLVRYGAEPSVYIYDRQNMAAGPYANPANGAVTAHLTTVAKGPFADWAFFTTEDSNDGFNGGVSPWFPYRQEVIGLNVMTGEVRRLAHHRSRSLGANYFYQPRVSVSWSGKFVGWASNFNQSGVANIYAVPFAGPSSPDTTPPTVSMIAPSNGATVSGTAVTVSANASDNVGVVGVQFKLDGANLGAEVTAAPYSFSWNTTLASTGAHLLTAVARDAAGNTATAAAVSVTVDNTPPMLSTVSASSLSSVGALITWATNKASDSQVDYGPTTAYGSSTPVNASLLTAHAVTLTGLLSATTYHYRVKSRDAAGNLATSRDFTLTTLRAVPDTMPPSVPTNLSASAASSTQTALTWTASTDNVGVAGYTIYRGAVQIATTALTSYSDTGLSPGTTYSYTVAG